MMMMTKKPEEVETAEMEEKPAQPVTVWRSRLESTVKSAVLMSKVRAPAVKL